MLLARNFFLQRRNGSAKKEKRSKKERKGRLWKLPQQWKSDKVAFGDFFLMISTSAWKTLRKKRYGFYTITTGPAATNYSTMETIVIYIQDLAGMRTFEALRSGSIGTNVGLRTTTSRRAHMRIASLQQVLQELRLTFA